MILDLEIRIWKMEVRFSPSFLSIKVMSFVLFLCPFLNFHFLGVKRVKRHNVYRSKSEEEFVKSQIPPDFFSLKRCVFWPFWDPFLRLWVSEILPVKRSVFLPFRAPISTFLTPEGERPEAWKHVENGVKKGAKDTSSSENDTRFQVIFLPGPPFPGRQMAQMGYFR